MWNYLLEIIGVYDFPNACMKGPAASVSIQGLPYFPLPAG